MGAKEAGDGEEFSAWLTADEREAWLGLVRVMAKLPPVLDDQLERDADLNYFEYIVLAVLSEQPDRTLRMSELAAVTNANLTRLSNVVKRLESRALLRRTPDTSNGRFTRAVLTDAGLRTVEAAAPGHVQIVREMVIDAITPAQLRQLRVATTGILQRLDPEGATRPRTRPEPSTTEEH